MSEQYILLKLVDAKLISSLLTTHLKNTTIAHAYVAKSIYNNELAGLHPIIARFEQETGADISDIVKQLKSLGMCPACVIESQEHTCSAHAAHKLGRRLSRLVDRANST